MSITTDTDALKWFRSANEEQVGRFGESLWKQIFKASGIMFIPLANIENGGAPKMESANGGTVLPDFDCSSAEWTVFLDSKVKRGPVLWRKTNQLRHGIDLRHYYAYQRVAESFKKRSGICLVELFNECEADLDRRGASPTWSGRLKAECLKNIGEPILDDPQAKVSERKAYWPAKVFADLDTLGPLELFRIAKGEIKPPSYRIEFEQIFNRKKQVELFA